MTATGSAMIAAATRVASADVRVLQGENARTGNGLGGERFAYRLAERAQGARPPRQKSSHSGTSPSTPLRSGPRLVSAFVAQALGQVMTADAGDRRSALAAYERNDVRRGRLFDKNA